MRTQTLDDNTWASHPGGVKLSPSKLKVFHPELYSRFGWLWFLFSIPFFDLQLKRRSFWLTHVEEHLFHGDSRAAVVVSTSPVLVAAYTDELDCIAMLRFDDRFADKYSLRVGSRLITVNTYHYLTDSYEPDLEPGPNSSGTYGNFSPFIADFLTREIDKLELCKAEIDEHEWQRTMELGAKYLADHPLRARDGRPLRCSFPAEPLSVNAAGKKNKDSVTHFSAGELVKFLFFLVSFVLLTLWGVRHIPRDPRTGWFGTILFGTMAGACVVKIFQICRAEKAPIQPKTKGVKQRVRSAVVWAGTGGVAIFLGLADRYIAELPGPFSTRLNVWLGTFLTTTAFYPFRGEQQKEYLPGFFWWVVYCALMGLVSVGLDFIMSIKRWVI